MEKSISALSRFFNLVEERDREREYRYSIMNKRISESMGQ